MLDNPNFRVIFGNDVLTQMPANPEILAKLAFNAVPVDGKYVFTLMANYTDTITQMYRISGCEVDGKIKFNMKSILWEAEDIVEFVTGTYSDANGEIGITLKLPSTNFTSLELIGFSTGVDGHDRFLAAPLGGIEPTPTIVPYDVHSNNVEEYADVTLNVDMTMGPLPKAI